MSPVLAAADRINGGGCAERTAAGKPVIDLVSRESCGGKARTAGAGYSGDCPGHDVREWHSPASCPAAGDFVSQAALAAGVADRAAVLCAADSVAGVVRDR